MDQTQLAPVFDQHYRLENFISRLTQNSPESDQILAMETPSSKDLLHQPLSYEVR
jgi:hypothetical protein